MPLIRDLARLEAVASDQAQPVATVRHRHLAEHPLVFVPLTTAGETGAPLGAMVGTDPERPLLLSVAQPRDRDLRFAFLAALADALLPHLESAQDDTEQLKEDAELCTDAPQLLVPNPAGLEFVRLLGRSTRFRRTAEEDPEGAFPAPARVPLLGRWLTHYGERARVPGSALLLAMTETLSRHWATGQSSLEDQHLGALLAWLRTTGAARAAGPRGTVAESASSAALRAETARGPDGLLLTPPAGPSTDPRFDNLRLAPAVRRYDAGLRGASEEIHELVGSQLRPVWDAMWEGVELLRTLPPGDRVATRWESDRWSYTAHRDRVRAGEPPQPRRDDAVTAARKLAVRERDQVRLAAQEALDDPLVMAERRLAGEAFLGTVLAVEMTYSSGKRPMPRPLVTMSTTDEPRLVAGGRVYRVLPSGSSQTAELLVDEEDDPTGQLTVRLTGGMGRSREPAPGSVPEPGETVVWTLFEHAPRGGPSLPEPEDTPWTHGGPPAPSDPLPRQRGAAAGEVHLVNTTLPDPVTSEDLL